MGEFVKHDPEGEPYFAYDGNMGVVVATLDNTTVYTHSYEYRGLDHIYTAMRDTGPSTTGAFLFRVALMETFDDVLGEMRAEGFQEITADKPDKNDERIFGMFLDANFGYKIKSKKVHRWLDGSA
jgi:hypothetical protein